VNIKEYFQNPRVSSLILDAKNKMSDSNIINVKDLSFNGLWPYNLYLDMLDEGELLEITPVSIRMRKKTLDHTIRGREDFRRKQQQ